MTEESYPKVWYVAMLATGVRRQVVDQGYILFPALIRTAELTIVTANSRGMSSLWSAGMSFDTCLRSNCAILADVSEQSLKF